MKTTKNWLIVAALCTATFAACKKEKVEATADSDVSTAQENSMAEGTYNDMGAISDQAVMTGGTSNYRTDGTADMLSGCATVTFDTLLNPKKITVDFGNGCLGRDGHYRAGILNITYTARYRDSGAVITITPENYFVDAHKIEGTKTVKNKGRVNGHFTFQIIITDGKITKPNGKFFTYACDKTREWLSGYDTPKDPSDDKWGITGDASGSNSDGKSYTAHVRTQLVRDFSCIQGSNKKRKAFVSGVLEFTPNGKDTRVIDFGDGTCDGKATVEIRGRKFEIDL